MDYLHLFSSATEHKDAWMDLNVYNEPWVSYDTESYHVSYNHTEFDMPIVTFIDNCNSDEYAYFMNLKNNSNTPAVNNAESKAFNNYYVTHTTSGNTITFTKSSPTDEMGCFKNLGTSMIGVISGNEIFVDNGDGTYTQTAAWELTNPTIGPWVGPVVH